MDKNVKKIFLLSTLIILFVSIAGVSAADTTDDIQDESLESQIDTSTNDYAIQTEVNKNINKENKTIKTTPTENMDYYVSDTDGNDENDGSQSNPFKTIKTAIDKTDSEKIYNIYISEGTYKGEGNTNLTIPGDNYINIIGAGVNITVFDGEANFDVQRSGFYWGSSDAWFSYVNGTGNWIMNITNGTGLITITNFTIQHSWSNGTKGGSAIGLYPEATVDNWGTLRAENVYFYQNYAGLGAGIRNNPTGTLYVENCTFDNNTKSVSTGNFGAAVYNNGTAYINNSVINNNYARWGTVTNDKTLYISNSTFTNNKGYDGTSGQKNGPGIYTNTGGADFFAVYDSEGLYTNVDSCTFESNQQCDINIGKADVVVNNCTFNNSCGIYITANNTNPLKISQNYTNNHFINMQDSTMFVTMLSTTKPSYAIHSLGTYNITIENNTIDVPNTVYGYSMQVAANTVVKNNTMNNVLKVTSQNDTIIENLINTSTENTITLTSAAKNCTIANNTLYASAADGDFSISTAANDTVIENNKPTVLTYVVNDENYTSYFNENGLIKSDIISNGSKMIFVDNITAKDLIFDNVKLSVDVNTTLINTTITTQNNAKIAFNNLKINNTRNDKGYVILLNSTGNTIKNASIQAVSDSALQAIKIEEDSNIITGSTINATAPAYDTQWNSDYSIGTTPTAGIFIRSSNNKINNTKVYLNASTMAESAYVPSVDGIDIQSKAVGEYVIGNEIRSSRINITGGSYVYGLNIARAKQTTTPLTWIDVTSTNYAAGIQMGDSDYNNISGYVLSKADNIAYGYYSTAMATGITNNTNLSKLYLQNIEAPTATGIAIEGASNVELSNATYTIKGEVTTAIDINKDWMYNKPENIFINALTINLNGQNDTSSMISIQETSNVFINKSTIKSTAGSGISLINTTNVTVTNNYMNAAGLIGGNAAVSTNTEATINNNTPNIAILTDDTYSQFFDENSTFYSDVDIITLGGDLHNKILRFTNPTKVINITNAADYTMYNSTLIIAGNGTYGDRYGFTVDKINFNNTNQAVFVDEFNGTGQKNVKFVNTTIYITGEDIVAFDAFNNNSYIYLDISKSNITMDGTNVVTINYAGYNRGQPAYVYENNINVTAENNAIIFNTSKATIQFSKNNVTINANNAIASNLENTSISYYNYQANNINITADTAMALNMTKGDTYTTYINQNNISIKANNPTTAINITGSKTLYIKENQIIVESSNGQTPLVYVENPSSQVTDNYLLANDIYGDNAVAGNSNLKISNNMPTLEFAVDEIVAYAGDTINITARFKAGNNTLTNINGGKVVFKVNGKTVKDENGKVIYAKLINGSATIEDYTVPKSWIKDNITIEAVYSGCSKQASARSEKVIMNISEAETTFTTESINATVGSTITLKATITEGNKLINTGKVVFKVNGKIVKDANGKVIYVKVVNGTVSLNYTIPDTFKAKEYTIVATYISIDNVKMEDTKTLTVTKA